MKKDKRTLKRSPIELAASFGIPEESLALHNAQVKNISYGGFSFKSKERMPVGKKVQLVLELGAEKQAVLAVKVVWQNKDDGEDTYTIGVQIDNPSPEEYEKFAEFLSCEPR